MEESNLAILIKSLHHLSNFQEKKKQIETEIDV